MCWPTPRSGEPSGAGCSLGVVLPVGSGLGSGAAATTSLALAAMTIAGHTPESRDLAFLAWQGDVIAHGGVASGLDSGAIALGGVTRYTLENGSQPLACRTPLPLVIGDSGVRADTAEINTRVGIGLSRHPARAHLFAEMGLLVRHALEAIEVGDLEELGRLMNLNQLLLEKLGVSSPSWIGLSRLRLVRVRWAQSSRGPAAGG